MKKLLLIILIFCLFTSFTRPENTWVVNGDSINYLNEHTNETDNRVTKGYMTRVQEKLSYICYTNQGYKGWTSGGIAEI